MYPYEGSNLPSVVKLAKGAFVSESALHSFDGDKPNSVGSRKHSGPDDHLSLPDFSGSPSRSSGIWCDDTRVFYAACRRMVFGLSSSKSRQRGTHQRSSAIGDQFITNPKIWKPGNQENGAPGGRALPFPSWIRGFQISSLFCFLDSKRRRYG